MKILVDDIPMGVKSITFDISFHDGFEGRQVSPDVIIHSNSNVTNVKMTNNSGDILEEKDAPSIPDVNIDDRPPKEIPAEMQDISF